MNNKQIPEFICKIFLMILLLVAFSTVSAGYESSNAKISNIYSDINSCDVTIKSETTIQNLILSLQLFDDGNFVDEKRLFIDELEPESKNIRVVSWDIKNPDESSYKVSARLIQNSSIVDSKNHSFHFGSPAIPRITVDDVVSDSNGLNLIVNPRESVIADIEYMLVNGSEVIYTAEDMKVSIHSRSVELRKRWGVILKNNRVYHGRLKINLHTPVNDVHAFMTSFTAKDNAVITDIYKDEVGSSVTIAGKSQVPFSGYLEFRVLKNKSGSVKVVESAVKKSPVLLDGEDETVEVIWNNTLPKGIYKLTVELVGNDGDLIDKKETIIESDYRQTSDKKDEEKEAGKPVPGFLIFDSLMIFTTIAVMYWIRK
ncbi:conserved hypothetical protein [Methanohalobium evestigatum Z-7303]|uniref:Uncharacterized protein n=2 Tax=Methanohalobium evestigatum TaxID=2322 RepID=D7E7V9_METEZ|nr:conserved hypothetical protein [Methanohalobium evestigatum Z-7303]